MSTEQLSSRYCMYKEGTDRLVRWIIKTASSCRRSFVKSSDGTVSTKELLECTRSIVEWKPPVEIPVSTIELLEGSSLKLPNAILGDLCARNFTRSSTRGLRQRSKAIVVMRTSDARATRSKKSRTTKASAQEDHASHPPKATEKLNNLFQNLQIEEPCEAAWSSAASKKERKDSAPRAPATLQVDKSAEKRFSIWCFLQDAKEIRDFVKQIWHEWRDERRMSFEAAAVITETAMGIVRRAGDAVAEEHPEVAHYPHVLDLLGYETRVNSWTQIPTVLAEGTEFVASDAGNGEELLFPHAGGLLHVFWHHWNATTMFLAERAKDGVPEDARQMWSYKHPEDTTGRLDFHPFAKLMWKMFPDLYALVLSLDALKNTARDAQALFHGLRTMHVTGQLPLWLVCVVQICMDMHDIVGDEPIGLEILRERTTQAAEVLSKYAKIRERYGSHINASQLDKTIKEVERERKAATMSLATDKSVQFESLLPSADSVPSKAFRGLHILVGEKVDAHHALMHDAGVHIGNDGCVILAVAHLYKAARHAKLLRTAWTDMEWFLEQHSKRRAFVQDVGKYGGMSSFSRHFSLALGTPITMLARLKAMPRAAQSWSAVPRRAQQRMFDTPCELSLASDELYGREKAPVSHRDPFFALLEKMTEKSDADRQKTTSRRPGSGQKPKFTGLQLLETYKKMRIAEDMPLNFDYVSFWMACWEMLDNIRRAVADTIPELCTKYEDMLVLAIFDRAAEAERLRTPLEHSAMGEVAHIINAHVEKKGKGDELSKGAATRMRGPTAPKAPSKPKPKRDARGYLVCRPQ
ncbi:uncharacterized protein MYCFIDRAFT_177942 [Pseudocercospora fijiensis CIRAD86]|uniref:DUF6604 domain-containing protein n=1 Tax=Pseudocercospora fijiensis (strain CIRAD86) TaxID=383855 RepID=M3A3Z4_PSEFD|nr:uncharacterized protein MYCFIDRAFT_177942 [Pseudocercospora fijiensis CIRAD86]EME79331.1 hypothetical protein MYCFIDRAFT_177942 [Pseudocercospora fijiensis CIRAD86]